ncbi:major facilitator superfamily domain-containing protein [Phyllosticta citribraziliensis]|uniref:Major facilitator superfamily domain-containing protein n=1 Tax=Phyllosticta citribraziliensis TaxID=989973 RepID=A0ABR1LTE1_9PEZI
MAIKGITRLTTDRPKEDLVKHNTLGSLRLRHEDTNDIILIPTPSNDPRDPLSWSTSYRYYIAVLLSLAIFFANFLAAGPTVAIMEITMAFYGPPGPGFEHHISKIAYFFTTSALMQGMSNLFWMPLVVKYGRRPAYVLSFTMYTVCAAWAGGATSYDSELAARIFMGFGAGAAECLAPLTISDMFFLHERGAIMAIYTCFLSAGVSGGIIISGLITIKHDWRYIYWVSVALIGATTALVIFTFPETEFDRSGLIPSPDSADTFKPELEAVDEELAKVPSDSKEEGRTWHLENTASNTTAPVPKPPTTTSAHRRKPAGQMTYWDTLRLYTGIHTREPMFKLFIRPVMLLLLPPVLWATLVMSVTIGFVIAISSNFATAFAQAYGFEAWQSGLCFISGLIGSALGIFFGGHVGDWCADYLTRRNGGVREPEMRLPAMAISLVAAPLSLVLYGEGVGLRLHWMCATVGLGLLNFSIVQATNISLVYTIDAYRPVAGEITVSQLGFKSAFGFLLSFYTNPWINKDGYERAFGAMAGITGAVILGFIPFYFYGKRIRHATWKWRIVRSCVHWDQDREVGE